MKCANCGGIIEDSDYVCPYCGEELKGTNTGLEQTDDKTYIGDFHIQDDAVDLDEKTVLDSGRHRYGKADVNLDEMTQVDSSLLQKKVFHQYDENHIGSFVQEDRHKSDQWNPEQTNSNVYQQNTTANNGAYYAAGQEYYGSTVNVAHGNTISTNNENLRKSSKPVVMALVLIVLIGILAISAFFFLTANRKPTIESMTYQDLIVDYELTSDESDTVKNAFHDRTRIEFEDFQKGDSGYKATAYVYIPDMNSIYEKSVDENEIVDTIRRTADSELDNRKEKVQWNQSGKELTKNSAMTLQRAVDDQYFPVTDYIENTNKTNSSNTSQSSGTSSSSGNTATSNNNQGNNTPSPSLNSGSQNNTDDVILDDDFYEDESYFPFYGVWCAGYKTEAEAISYIQSSGLVSYNPQVFITTQWSNLNKEKWYVVTAGVYGTKSAANDALSSVKSIVPDAYVKYSGDWIG